MARPKKPFPPRPARDGTKMRVWWNGRWHHLGLVADGPGWQAEYAQLIALWSADPFAEPLRGGGCLLSTLCRDYLASADSPRAGLQRERVATAVGLLAELHPATAVADFGPVELRAWQTWLCGLKDAAGRGRFARSTVKYHVDVVRRIIKWGVGTGRVPPAASAALAAVPRPRADEARAPRVVSPANPAHVEAALPFMLPEVRAMVVLQRASGARPCDVCRLTPGEVHRGGVLDIPGFGEVDVDALGVWLYTPGQHKNAWRGLPRVLVIAGAARDVLRPYLEGRAPDAPCFSPREAMAGLRRRQRAEAEARRGGEPGGSRKRLSGNTRLAAAYRPRAYYHAVARACAKAGVPRWFPYQIRHRTAADAKVLGGLDAAQALLGHHSRTMTEHYGGAALRTAAALARRLAGEA